MRRSTAFRVMGVKCQHFVECVAAASPTPSFSGSEFALGALKAVGPGVRGRHSRGTPTLALGPAARFSLLRWERVRAGAHTRGGWGTAAPRSGLRGRKHIWIFAASLFAVEGLPGQCQVRAAGALPGVAQSVRPPGPSLPSGTSEKNERQPQRRGWRCPLPVWTGQQKGRGGPRPTRCFRGRMRTGARALRSQLSRLPPLASQKEQEINIQIHLSS